MPLLHFYHLHNLKKLTRLLFFTSLNLAQFLAMAFNLQTFRTRAVTAVVFVAVMLAGLLFNYDSFFLLFSVIHFGCWFEYQKLVGVMDNDYKKITLFHKYGVMLLGWSFLLLMTKHVLLALVGKWLLIAMLVLIFVFEIIRWQPYSLKNLGYSLLGLLYISVSWMLMIDLRSKEFAPLQDGRIIPLILIASIWINDTMAYIVGSFIGKTPFSSISPKKTWEGTAGGALLAVVVITAVCYSAFHLPAVPVFIISLIAAVTGTLGDLLESKLKRMANVKDSGQIMPGHGGFLDRFDSLLLATPFVWLYLCFAL